MGGWNVSERLNRFFFRCCLFGGKKRDEKRYGCKLTRAHVSMCVCVHGFKEAQFLINNSFCTVSLYFMARFSFTEYRKSCHKFHKILIK